jgi:hypothetical protein
MWSRKNRKDDLMINENPTIDEAFESASSSLSNSESEVTEIPDQPEEATTEVETPEVEEKPIEESVEETPLDKFDPTKLPPELQQVYKDLQKGFTQGRQKDREEVNALRKEIEELRSQTTPPEEEDPNLSPEEQVERIAEKVVLSKKLEDFRETALQEYNSLDPRLNNQGEEFDPIMDSVIGAQLDQLLDKYVDEHGNELGFDYKSHGKELIKNWDEYLSSNTQRFLTKQKDMAKKQETSIRKMNPTSTPSEVKPTGKMSLEQAMQAAYEKVR